MSRKYSSSTGGFYDIAIHGSNVPADAVDITNVEYTALLEGQSAGKIIAADATGAPVLKDPTKANADQVWELIRAKRDTIKAGGVKVGGSWFNTDDSSRVQQIGLVMMGASIPAGLQWKTMDGSFVTMTQALASQIFQAVAGHDMQAFSAAETHRLAMEASDDPSAYDFSEGWPESFSG